MLTACRVTSISSNNEKSNNRKGDFINIVENRSSSCFEIVEDAINNNKKSIIDANTKSTDLRCKIWSKDYYIAINNYQLLDNLIKESPELANYWPEEIMGNNEERYAHIYNWCILGDPVSCIRFIANDKKGEKTEKCIRMLLKSNNRCLGIYFAKSFEDIVDKTNKHKKELLEKLKADCKEYSNYACDEIGLMHHLNGYNVDKIGIFSNVYQLFSFLCENGSYVEACDYLTQICVNQKSTYCLNIDKIKTRNKLLRWKSDREYYLKCNSRTNDPQNRREGSSHASIFMK